MGLFFIDQRWLYCIVPSCCLNGVFGLRVLGCVSPSLDDAVMGDFRWFKQSKWLWFLRMLWFTIISVDLLFFFFLVWFGNVDNIFYDVAVSSVTVLLMVCLSVCFLTNNNSCYYNETFGFSLFRSVSVWHRWVYCITDIYFLLMSLGVKDFKMGFSVFWWCGIWDFSWLSILEKHTYTLWYWKLWVLLKSTQWQFFLLLQ